ncbi:hypothetical protein CIC12_13655 [Burkholderia sp. SG-MS1]|uniref:MaoC/PaaZ C-terminal domain-containing protein n=1 Tax=Paraburkholderia sp. SG-MS1 TaxID=2023741 RepID=UPI0014450170|nr:MaoC/PaaZ C-terminal domain-containing protein [Paraburkholderia sp. SG-MS1]NKJ47767.1 hypothetical protein [Paraburkholderia sp. SG-MS1]
MPASRRFRIEDQNSFALLSGDSNPVHVDALKARRSQFGRPIVHGMHLLLWAIEEGLADTPKTALAKISCVFRNPVRVDEEVLFRLVKDHEQHKKIVLECNGAECATVHVELSANEMDIAFTDRSPGMKDCHERSESSLDNAQGSIPLELDTAVVRERFPVLTHKVPLGQVALILATTRLVGMECPGLHSIYSGLSVSFSPSSNTAESEGRLDWKVVNYDDRFRRLSVDIVADGATGVIQAMLRPAPHKQKTCAELKTLIPDAEMFAGQRALVIGGSRGLGELCAKILAVGGADVRLTYHRGKDDAQAVVADINNGPGKSASLAYDMFDPPEDLQKGLGDGWTPTHVYYFATPPIFVATRGKFSSDLFARFSRYYVEGFYTCWQSIRQITPEKFTMFYPSSVAVETPYLNMGEYAAAKAAGENLCSYLCTCDKKLTIKVVRLPRLPSDQTLSIVEVKTHDPVETILGVLGEFRSEQLA